jgi:hypothetical protein
MLRHREADQRGIAERNDLAVDGDMEDVVSVTAKGDEVRRTTTAAPGAGAAPMPHRSRHPRVPCAHGLAKCAMPRCRRARPRSSTTASSERTARSAIALRSCA